VAVRTFVRRCWLLLRPAAGPPEPFAVACECGGTVSGLRQARPQTLRCPLCARPLFVLPRSRWPLPAGERPPDTPAPPPPTNKRPRPWRMPLLAGAVTLALVVAAFLVLLPLLVRPTQEQEPRDRQAAEQVRKLQASARRALREGKYHQAFKDADAAKELSDRDPDALPRDERRDVAQLWRQSDLLARLLDVPLQEIVKQASLAPEDDWEPRFRELYRGRAVLFDDRLRYDGVGRPALNTYEVRLGDERVRLAVDDLKVLSHLPLDPPPRVLFGARLAKVGREQGAWVVRFDPDSGVLFTDPDAALCVPADDELRAVLERQAEWLKKYVEPEK
jgi:hypothetical protein